MPDFYGTASAFRTYLTARGLPTPSGADVDATVNAKLLVASQWLDSRYYALFPGRKTNGRSQVREWPRTGASDREGYAIDSALVPTEVENATYEAARREFAATGSLSQDYTPNKYRSAAVSGAVSVTYANFNSAEETQVQLQIVNDLLSPILCGESDHNMLSGGSCR